MPLTIVNLYHLRLESILSSTIKVMTFVEVKVITQMSIVFSPFCGLGEDTIAI